MNLFVIAKIIGVALNVEAGLMMVPLLFAAYYGENVMPYLISAFLGFCIGLVLWIVSQGEHKVKAKEGFVSAGLTWIVLSLIGMLPFLLFQVVDSGFDAFFETVSGFTTTGATILKDIEALPKSLNWYSCPYLCVFQAGHR